MGEQGRRFGLLVNWLIRDVLGGIGRRNWRV
jgi:hypothetical protein